MIDTDTNTPRELIGSTPRRIRLLGDGVRIGIISATFLAFPILLGIWSCIQIWHRAELQRDGLEVVGKVTGFGSGRGAGMVKYSFSVNGTAFSGQAPEPENLFGRIGQFDRIRILFLPENPAINHPEGWEWTIINPVGDAVMIFIAILGGIFMSMLFRERRLAREGIPAVGVVTSIARKNRTFWVEYGFSTDDRRPITGSGYSSDPQEIGASVWVLYLPQNPGRNQPYPLSSFRVDQ
jgi:hypothetical protein